jgi:myosin heavy subunit
MKDKMKDKNKNIDPKSTITAYFKNQLDELIETLSTTNPR